MHPYIYHEKRTHGTAEFPAAYYYVDSKHPRYHMSTHWHTEWELIRILEGEFRLHANETELLLKAGDVVLLPNSMLHGGTPVTCRYECLVFNLHGLFRTAENVKKHLRPFYRMQIYPFIHFPALSYPEIYDCTTRIMEACARFHPQEEGTLFWELSILGNLCEFFSIILRKNLYSIPAESNLHHQYRLAQIKTVLEYIEQNYGSRITLSNLADQAGMNPNYFCKVFQEITHQTPMDYVFYYRIDQAAVLLSTTRDSVTDIALACGFNDHSYFTKSFKRVKDETPRSYRKSHMQMPV